MLIAVYTWKKKFAGKNVRVFNDNLSVVNMINHGLPKRPGQYYKPFIVSPFKGAFRIPYIYIYMSDLLLPPALPYTPAFFSNMIGI